MSEIVPTLFGLSPQAFQQQRQQQADAQALALAQLDPFERASFGIQRGANRLAGAIGGMLGGQDPELERRTQAHQIMGMIDPANPDTFLRAAEMALQGGDQQLAFGLRQEGEKARQQFLLRQDATTKRTQEAEALRRREEAQRVGQGAVVPGVPEQEQFVQVDEQNQPVAIPAVPASFDVNRVQNQLLGMGPEGQAELERLVAAQRLTQPEEFNLGDRRFRRNTDGSLLEVVSAVPAKPGITTRPLTTEEARSQGLPTDKPYQIDSTGKVSQIGGGGVNVDARTIPEDSYEKFVRQDVGKEDSSTVNNARNAEVTLPKMIETRELLKNADLNTGIFAEYQQVLSRAQAKFLGDKKAGKVANQTEYLNSLLGSDVFPQISILGIGARGIDTPAEREFLREVLTGSITLTLDTLKQMTDRRIKAAESTIERYNKSLADGELDRYQDSSKRKLFPIPLAVPVANRFSNLSDEDLDAAIAAAKSKK